MTRSKIKGESLQFDPVIEITISSLRREAKKKKQTTRLRRKLSELRKFCRNDEK